MATVHNNLKIVNGRGGEEDKAKLKHGNIVPCQKKFHPLTKIWRQFQ